VFVTRFPCAENSDGHLLPLVTVKPLAMAQAVWDDLVSRPFGGIIFGKSPPGQAPLPTLIANGDNDGDLYFVCWSENILTHLIVPEPLSLAYSPPTASQLDQPWNENWLADAQKIIGDVQDMDHHHALIAHLHRSREKSVVDVGYDAPDTVQYGRAMKEAIDIIKQGGSVNLPRHLWTSLPERFHKYLIDL